MYNMEITLFGFKLNLEILILIGVIYLILVAHTVGGCCNMPLIMEGLSTMTNKNVKKEVYSKIEGRTKASFKTIQKAPFKME